MAFKLKGGVGGPFQKNFPSAFKQKSEDDYMSPDYKGTRTDAQAKEYMEAFAQANKYNFGVGSEVSEKKEEKKLTKKQAYEKRMRDLGHAVNPDGSVTFKDKAKSPTHAEKAKKGKERKHSRTLKELKSMTEKEVEDMGVDKWHKAVKEASTNIASTELQEEGSVPAASDLGFMTEERKKYLEGLTREMTTDERREYTSEAFNPDASANQAFSAVAMGSTGLGITKVPGAVGSVATSLSRPFVNPTLNMANTAFVNAGKAIQPGISLGSRMTHGMKSVYNAKWAASMPAAYRGLWDQGGNALRGDISVDDAGNIVKDLSSAVPALHEGYELYNAVGSGLKGDYSTAAGHLASLGLQKLGAGPGIEYASKLFNIAKDDIPGGVSDFASNAAVNMGFIQPHTLGSSMKMKSSFKLGNKSLPGIADNGNVKKKHGFKVEHKKLDEGIVAEATSANKVIIDKDVPKDSELYNKALAHEGFHAKEMEEDKIEYGKDFVRDGGSTYHRKDGKIKYNGKWLPEGDSAFPWEKRAKNAENYA